MEVNKINLLQVLINATEKAANIARVCRTNSELLALLVQEKTGIEANSRFEHDFKTLADVLIQETIKHDVGTLFPSMMNHIRGEESPNFTNSMGESVTICVGETVEQTAKCLSAVLHNYPLAAKALAEEVHREVIFSDSRQLGLVPELPSNVNYDNLGMWIDPIDATAEYIKGATRFSSLPGITSSGLDCVTVLIGVYELSTGVPVMGVIGQPFKHKLSIDDNTVYKSRIYWGICFPTLQANSVSCLDVPTDDIQRNYRCILSTSEQEDILLLMQNLRYEFVFSAGAGHKALKVITAEVEVYILSKGSTFLWDTCAPHAILRSLGGDIFDLKRSLELRELTSLKYNIIEEKCNAGGMLAVTEVDLAGQILDKLLASPGFELKT